MEKPLKHEIPKDCWVVVAAFNEDLRLGGVLDQLASVAENIVVVDDGSSDETFEIARQRPAWVLRHPVNLGQGAALQTGIEFALKKGAELIVTFDADGQHSVEDIPGILAPLVAGEADFSLGSRFLGQAEGIPFARKLMLRVAVVFTWMLYGVRLSDAHNGLRGMTATGGSRIRLEMNRMGHASELVEQIAQSGLRYTEVPVTIRYTLETLSKGQRNSDSIRLALRLLLRKATR